MGKVPKPQSTKVTDVKTLALWYLGTILLLISNYFTGKYPISTTNF
jgi:hypothetical protein